MAVRYQARKGTEKKPLAKRDLPAFWPPRASLASTLGISIFLYTTAINAALVHALTPALIVLVSLFTLGEQTTARQLVGLLVSIFGATAVITRGSASIVHAPIQY